MKPFDLQKALAGEPVVTRDGREAILHPEYPLNFWLGNHIVEYTLDGTCYCSSEEHVNDLFMKDVPETKYIVLGQTLEGRIEILGTYNKNIDALSTASQVCSAGFKKVKIVIMDIDND